MSEADSGAKRISSASPMHILLLADNSQSMAGHPAEEATKGLQNWILELQQATRGRKSWFRFTYLLFGTRVEVKANAVNINDVDHSTARVEGDGGDTNMGLALRAARDIIQNDGSTAADCPPFVFLYTDGHATDPKEARIEALALKLLVLPGGRSPVLVTIGVGDVNGDLLRSLASTPRMYKYCKDYEALKNLLPAMGTPTATRAAASGPGPGPHLLPANTVEGFKQQIETTEI